MSQTNPPASTAQLALFGGLDLSVAKLMAEEGEPTGSTTPSLSQRRQRELVQAIESRNEDRVAQAIASFPSGSGLPPTVEGKRVAEILADHFSASSAARLVSAGLAVPNTSGFLEYLHGVGNAECVDWFLRNTRLGEMPNLPERAKVFFRTVRRACQSGDYELGMYYLAKCPLTSPDIRTPEDGAVFFSYCVWPVLETAMKSGDPQKLGDAILAIDRHKLLLPVIHTLSNRLEMTDLATIQKACVNPEVARAVSRLFPMNLGLDFYCQSTLVVLDLRVPEQKHLVAEDFIEFVTLQAAPALNQLLSDTSCGPRVAALLVDKKDAPRRLAYFSFHAQERRLAEMLPHLFKYTHTWRDSNGNNVGHYLAARPTTDARQERVQLGPSSHSLVASHGPGSRGEMLVQHARQWCLEENEDGKNPLAFIIPKARASLTRQILRSMAPIRSGSKRNVRGM